MLLLVFDLDGDRFALDVRHVVEVLPLVSVTCLPHAPPGVAGVVNYRGVPVPVIDLADLMRGRPSCVRLSTRLAIVRYRTEAGGEHALGLMLEHATDVIRRPDTDFVASGITTEAVPYLGPVATDAHGVIQLVNPSILLPASVRDVLFKQTVTD